MTYGRADVQCNMQDGIKGARIWKIAMLSLGSRSRQVPGLQKNIRLLTGSEG
jgi:hypothetical protein